MTVDASLSFVRVVVKHNDKILVMKEATKAGRWNLPGGKIDAGECPKDAARRELFEETRLVAGDLHFINEQEFVIDGQSWHGVFYLAENIRGVPTMGEPVKCSDLTFKSLPELLHLRAMQSLLYQIAALEIVAGVRSSFAISE